MESTTRPRPRHLGRKIMQMRELLGIRQEAVAEQLGITQQAISKLEQKEEVDDETLDKVAKAIGVTPDAIKNLDDEATVYNIVHNSSFTGSGSSVSGRNYNCSFNPLDKYVEAVEKNEKLYEALLKSERGKGSHAGKAFG